MNCTCGTTSGRTKQKHKVFGLMTHTDKQLEVVGMWDINAVPLRGKVCKIEII